MIIQFTGAQSTGKTRMSDFLVRRFGFVFERENARVAHQQGFQIDIAADSLSQCYMNNMLLQRFFNSIQNRSVDYMFDRSFICCYVYGKAAGIDHRILSQTQQLIQLVDNIVDLTVYFPLNIPFKPDGVRQEDSRELIDQLIVEILNDLQINYITMIPGTIDERARFMSNEIVKKREELNL